MPILRGRDKHGPYYQFGQTGHKYYYLCGRLKSRELAYSKVVRQAKAIQRRRGFSL